jgi:hypothetical protein
MLKRMTGAACVLTCAAAAIAQGAQAADAGVMWAANPTGMQTVPEAAPIALMPSSGYVPLQTSAGKCLLVARRGTRIVAIELSPVKEGATLLGWKPQVVDMNTVTSKWGYRPQGAGSSTTMKMGADTSGINKDGSYSTSSTWTNTHVAALASGESESAVTVTVNGKTYRKYSHFKAATADTPDAASDETICE